MSGITEVGRVMVPVADQDRAITFYTDKLGFSLAADVPFGEGDRWVEVAPPSGGRHSHWCPRAATTRRGG